MQIAWDEMEPPLLRFALRAVLTAGFIVASPFFAAAFLFFLLERPTLWIWVPVAIGIVPLIAAFVGWLYVRSKLRDARERIDRVASIQARWREEQP